MSKKKAKPVVKTPEPLPTAFSVKGTDAWRDWVFAFCKFTGRGLPTQVERALAASATAEGFTIAPPPRIQD